MYNLSSLQFFSLPPILPVATSYVGRLEKQGKDKPESVGHFPDIVKIISSMNKAVKQDLAGRVKRSSGLMMMMMIVEL